MNKSEKLQHEARLFATYLVKRPPSNLIIKRYVDALRHNPQTLNRQDSRLLDFIHMHPWSLGYIEAGLALRQPYSEVRRRLYVMLAILESSPDYTTAFLPQQRSLWYMGVVLYAGLRACCKTVAGLLFVGVFR
jgi:hypothetical protein